MNVAKLLFYSVFFISAFASAVASDGAVDLRDVSSQSESKRMREALWLYISADGSWYSDSGATSREQLTYTFERWRADGVEPGVQLNLFPKLKSNSNLVTIKNIIDFLKEKKISYSIRIEAVKAEPEAGLR